MMAAVEGLAQAEELIAELECLGYEWGSRDIQDVPDRRYFVRRRQDGASTHHLSLATTTSHCWRTQLAFRDWLRARPDVRDAYADLKRDLAARFPADRPAYLDGKTDFVRQVIAAATGGPDRAPAAPYSLPCRPCRGSSDLTDRRAHSARTSCG
jgi:GrpB-like predicted nucleotidyltransferase (UPF0157 family)